MKKKAFLFCICSIIMFIAAAQNVGIGTSSPAGSAQLDISSTTRGLLPPRMTAVQRNTIASPANGLMVYDTDSAALMVRSAGVWYKLSSTALGDLWRSNGGDAIYSGNAGNVGIGVSAPLFKLDLLGRMLIRGDGNLLNSPGVVFTNPAGTIYNGLVGTQSDSLIGFYGSGNNIPNNGWGLNMNIYNGRVGIGTNNSKAALHVTDSAVLFSGPAVIPPLTTINPPVQGAGTRMFWFPSRGAFRSGYVDGVQWDRDSIGLLSFAAGYNTKAKAVFSTSFGRLTTASNSIATSMGFGTIASGEVSTSMGNGSAASGFVATSMGQSTLAIGDFSISMGNGTRANGNSATATGASTTAGGYASFSMGDSSIASGYAAAALGYKTKALGDLSTSMGNANTASGFGALSMGYLTVASGNTSTSMGISTVASGGAATSTGVDTKAKAYAGFSMGTYNDSTDAPNPSSIMPTDRLFQIGNGTANNQRSNALTVLRNGNMGIGTTNPVYPFHVEKSAANIFAATVDNQDATGWGLRVWTQDEGGTRNALQVYSGSLPTSRFIVRNDGNVGIAVTDPLYRLDIGGRMRIRSGGDLNNSAGIFFNNTGNTNLPAFVGMQSDDQVGFYGNSSGWSFVMNSTSGNVGIGTTTPTTKLEVNGFTKLGTDAPAIKVKKLTGTTASTDGGNTNIPHGLIRSKILSVSVLVESDINTFTPPSSTFTSGVQYNFDVYTNTIWIYNIPGNSMNILSKPFKVLITYEE